MNAAQVWDTQEFSAWYNDVIYKAEIVDESPVRGCAVIRPYGWAIWELIVEQMNERIKATGVQNAYFPLFIPETFLQREKDHVEGFSPELAVVTHAGGKKLAEPLVVRPTSETMVYHMFARWIKSHRDLPLKINQWANVVRWEMRTRPFLRTSEFLWQEGHTAHATAYEAWQTTCQFRDLYVQFFREVLAIPLLTGPKTPRERFAGAEQTLTIEALMQDGRALQAGTSHLLSASFPEAFGVQFQAADGSMQVPRCTSWGSTTRMLGAVIMVHGDKNGLVLPPKIAPIQVLIVPIYKTEEQRQAVFAYAQAICLTLCAQNIRAQVDLNEHKTPGFKFNQSELQGIPLRIEVGPRDLESNSCLLAARFDQEINGKKPKLAVALSELVAVVAEKLTQIQQAMFAKAQHFMTQNTFTATSFAELATKLETQRGFYRVFWCGDDNCEAKLKDIQASARLLIGSIDHMHCFVCSKVAQSEIVVARAY